MGFLRGAVITIFSIVLVISLFLMNFTLIVSWSLQHDNLQPALKTSATNFLKNTLNAESIFNGESESLMQAYCIVNKEYNFTYGEDTITIPCEVILKGEDAVIDYGVSNLIDIEYYKEYSCDFWKCVKDSQVPLVLFSEKAMDYWRGKFFLLLIVSFVLFALIFLISRKRPVTIAITGLLIIVSSLPFRKLDWVIHLIPKQFSGIISVFFTKAHEVFIIMLFVGLLFIGLGIAFRLLGLKLVFWESTPENTTNSGVSKSEMREIIKEEISKDNKPKKKKK
jgi:hypothetical protein